MKLCADGHEENYPGSKTVYGCDFLDADGNVIYHPDGGRPRIVFVDTTTGEVVQLARVPRNGTVPRYIHKYRAPLRVVKILSEYWELVDANPGQTVQIRCLIEPFDLTEPLGATL